VQQLSEKCSRAGCSGRVHRPPPFLPGVDGFWRENLQGKLDRQLVRALDCLGEMQVEIGEPQTAFESALEGIKWTPSGSAPMVP